MGKETMLDVAEIVAMQQTAVARWHQQGVDNPYTGFLAIACHQCSLNYLLWHEEDLARCPTATDMQIAFVKRTIDRLNQQRNDYLERLDHWVAAWLDRRGVRPADDATLHTETPGGVIDRLSILALRLFHLEEQLARPDVDAQHREQVRTKLSIGRSQHDDLQTALRSLVDDIATGRSRHRIYQPLKMYNDPALNPYLYARRASSAA